MIQLYDDLLDEPRDVAFRAIQPVELFFDVPLLACTVVLQR